MLILVLVFTIVVAMLAVSLLTLAWTGSTSLRAFKIERSRRYAADGALQSAVQMVKTNATLGQTSGSPACSMTFPIAEATGANITSVVAAGSYVTVSCAATTGVTSGGLDSDSGQRTRDVTFTVTCQGALPGNKGTLTCGNTGPVRVIGRARVRYEIDFGLTPSGSTCSPSVSQCWAHNARAVVPKVLEWSISG
ncbi:MAG: hypothetical protein R2701_01000 [Acidimicrobiales bacterium]